MDYRVTGDKATDANTYSLTITGIGGYAGTITKEYKVNPKDLKYVSIPAIDNQAIGDVPNPVITDGHQDPGARYRTIHYLTQITTR